MSDELALALALDGRVEPADAQVKGLVELSERLGALPDPEIDERFAAALEARLMTEGLPEQAPARRLSVVPEPQKAPKPAPVHRAPVVALPRRRFVLRRGIAAAAVAAMLGAFPAAAMGKALPGTPFYGMRKGAHELRVAMFGTPLEDGFSHLSFTKAIASDVEKLRSIDAPADDIALGAGDVKDYLVRGSALVRDNTDDRAALRRVAAIARSTETQMRSIVDGLSPKAQAAVRTVIKASRQIRSELAPVATTKPTVFLPAAEAQLRTTETSAQQATASTPTATTASGQDTTSTATRPANGGGKAGETTKGKDIDLAEGCSIPASAQLGDTLAPVARILCD